MTDIYLHIVARMDDYMDTHPGRLRRQLPLPIRAKSRLNCQGRVSLYLALPTRLPASRGRLQSQSRVELIGHFKPCMTDIYIPI